MKIGRFFMGAVAILITLSAIGWLANIIQIFNAPGPLSEASTWTILLAMKVIGIFAGPIGVVLGWIGILA